jgi:hypothetical protein
VDAAPARVDEENVLKTKVLEGLPMFAGLFAGLFWVQQV